MTSRAKHNRSIRKVLFLNLILVLLIFTGLRGLFYLVNASLFTGNSSQDFLAVFLAGLRFDLSAILLLNGLYIFFNIIPLKLRVSRAYQYSIGVFFWVPNILAFFASLADTVYFRYSLKRTTWDIFSYLSLGHDISNLWYQYLMDFWYMAVAWLLLSGLIVLVYVKNMPFRKKKPPRGIGYYIREIIWFMVLGYLAVIGVRGGWQLKPISIITASQYSTNQNVPLILNTPFTMIRTFGNKGLEIPDFYKDTGALEKAFPVVHKPSASATAGEGKKFRPLNVVVIILESFSTEHLAGMNPSLTAQKQRTFTPFLDSLMQKSLVFRGFANGKRSIEGIPAVTAGLPALMEKDFITSEFAGDKLTSLAGLLHKKGYISYFFHGGNNGTMGFESFSKSAGFDQYLGRTEYADDKDYDGKWGIWDEPFLQFTARKLGRSHQPFFATVFTLSSHHPYKVPPKYAGILPNGPLPILKTISYTDLALRKFFQTYSGMPAFDSTLFVITADHTSEPVLPYFSNRVGAYEVPVIFFMNKSGLRGRDGIAQQIDIMPSVLDFLNYDEPYVAFGRSVFDSNTLPFAVNYANGIYGLVQDGFVLQFDGSRAVSFYNLRNDSLLKHNLVNLNLPVQAVLEARMKAIIQQYNRRMRNNGLSLR